MRYLLLSSLALILFGCAPKVQPSGGAPLPADILIFKDTTGAYLYKNKIELYGHYLSGLMMIKPLPNQNYKVAMTTEFGAKIMDFEITDGRFKMNDVIEQMRRKRIMKLIEADMKLLFGVQQYNGTTTSLSDGKKLNAYQGKPLNGFYTLNAEGQVVAIDGYRKNKKMVESTITEYQNGVPKNLKVNHTDMPVQIELNLIKAPGYVPE